MMVKSMFKILRVILLIIVIIIAIITAIIVGISFYNLYLSHKERRAVIQRLEAQIAEMEANGTDEISYYIEYTHGDIFAYVNSIEDKKYMLKIIKDSKNDWIKNGLSSLLLGDGYSRPEDIIIADVGDIRIYYSKRKNPSYLRTQFIYPAHYKVSEQDLAAFRKFVLGLEQREPDNQN